MISHDAGVAGEREAFGSMVADARDAGVVGGPEASRARAADGCWACGWPGGFWGKGS